MRLIYATGKQERLSFAVTTTHTSLPAGAVVYAICDGESVVERFGEATYIAMTDFEYLRFKQMVDDAWQLELKRTRRQAPQGLFGRLLAWISGQAAPAYPQHVRAN